MKRYHKGSFMGLALAFMLTVANAQSYNVDLSLDEGGIWFLCHLMV